MPPGDDKPEKGKRKIPEMKHIGVEMGFHVVDRDQGFVPDIGQPFSRVDSDEKRPHQARALRHRNGIGLMQGHARLFLHSIKDFEDLDHMVPGSDLGNDSSEFLMDFLGVDHVGEDRPSVTDKSS